MATGSGKTLLLHINYLQFLHYHRQAAAKPLDNILLVTPNAGLSDQHLEEFAKSGIPAQRFRSSGGTGLQPDTVQVLEITKLSGKGAGQVTVHVDSFEGNNLVFVDEGHRGASGDVWIGLRDKLAAEGFTFEYSATFGEAFNKGSRPEDVSQRQSYGKAIDLRLLVPLLLRRRLRQGIRHPEPAEGLRDGGLRRPAPAGQPAGILRAGAPV